MSPPPRHAFLFGSFARNEADAQSDVDVVIVVARGVDPRSEAWAAQTDAITQQFTRWTGNDLQALSITAATLADLITTEELIVKNWRDDGLRLIGDDPIALLESGSMV